MHFLQWWPNTQKQAGQNLFDIVWPSIQVFCSSWLHVVGSLHVSTGNRHLQRGLISPHVNTDSLLLCFYTEIWTQQWSQKYATVYCIMVLQVERNYFSTHTGIREETSFWKTLVGFLLKGISFPAEGKTKCPSPCNFLSSLLQTHTGWWLTRLV